MQKINTAIHSSEVATSVVFSVHWGFLLLVMSPLGALFQLLVVMPFEILGIFWKNYKLAAFHNTRSDKHATLAILITGCDTGFGHTLALEFLSASPPPPPSANSCLYKSASYVIYAGCYNQAGCDALALEASSVETLYGNMLVPIVMDVTSPSSSVSAIAKLIKFVDATPLAYLHSVINNAGIGTPGLVDILSLDDEPERGKPSFKNDMDVNYYGMLRTVKNAMPLLKQQVSYSDKSLRYSNGAQVINITSMAGIVSSPCMSAYSSSKFAAEAMSTALRHELKPWGISVCTVNPSFHKTPLVGGIGPSFERLWESGMTEEHQDQYGRKYFNELKYMGTKQSQGAEWEACNVSDGIIRAVRDRFGGQLLIGLDAKLFISLMRHLPVWAQDYMVGFICPRLGPAMLGE